MLVAVDVHYGVAATTAALVGFRGWRDATAEVEHVEVHTGAPAAYEPGRFFARELPYLVAVLGGVTEPIELIVIDGYAWLAPGRPGLGVHLHERTGVPVVGVAKSAFAGAHPSPVVRGTSTRPLFVTAIGIDQAVAAAAIGEMHGPFRIPTLLKRVDSLTRGHARPTG